MYCLTDMKRALLLFLLPLAQLTAQTYTYKPMLSTTDWRVLTADLGGADTFWYHKGFTITENLKEYTAITGCDGLDPLFYIREDVASRKVFYKRTNEMQEHLLYNFNLKVGDLINVPIGMYEPNSTEYQVTKIDTITLPDGKHKRFFYKETEHLQRRTFTLIEGVGCTEDPFKIYYPTADPVFYLLNSYKGRNCQYVYGDSCPPNPCTFVSKIEQPEKTELKVYPNPCGDILQINSNETFQYQLVNSIGQTIQTGSCQSTFDMGELQKGLYILVLKNNGMLSSHHVAKE